MRWSIWNFRLRPENKYEQLGNKSCLPCLFKNQSLPPKFDGFCQVWNTLHLFVVLCLKLLISLRGRKRNKPARKPNPTDQMPPQEEFSVPAVQAGQRDPIYWWALLACHLSPFWKVLLGQSSFNWFPNSMSHTNFKRYRTHMFFSDYLIGWPPQPWQGKTKLIQRKRLTTKQ